MKKLVETGLEYSRLTEWAGESHTHRKELIDVIYRRHIPDGGCPDRVYAEAWLEKVFLLPKSAKEDMALFRRAPIWDPHERDWILLQIGSALRRLIADLKREEKQGYRTKRFLDGILSRHNRCKAYPKRLEIPDHLKEISGYETIVRIAENMASQILSFTIHFSDKELYFEVHTGDLLGQIEEAIKESVARLSNNSPVRLTLS